MWLTDKKPVRGIRAVLIALLFVLMAVPVAWSVTRTISDTQDTVSTFIRNSKGNYWEANGTNIQAAIDDLGSYGGTVWLPAATIDVNSTITVGENVKLFMHGTTINVTADVNVFEPKLYSEIAGGEISVEWLESTSDFTKSCIFVDADYQFNTRRSLFIHDIEFTGNTHGWTGYVNGTAVQLFSDSTGNIYSAEFADLWVRNFKYAVLINQSVDGSINGNRFNNIQIHNCVHGFWIQGSGFDYSSGNVFTDFVMQPVAGWSIDAIYVEGDQNVFRGMIFDVSQYTQSSAAINISEDARSTYVDTNLGSGNIADNQNHSMGWGGIIISNTVLSASSIEAERYLKAENVNYGSDAQSINFFQNTDSPQYFSIWAPNSNRGYFYVTNTSMTLSYPMSSNGSSITFAEPKIVTVDDILKLNKRTSAPTSPSDGMIAYADGTGWDPGSGEGIYAYYNGAWNKLG